MPDSKRSKGTNPKSTSEDDDIPPAKAAKSVKASKESGGQPAPGSSDTGSGRGDMAYDEQGREKSRQGPGDPTANAGDGRA